MSSWDPSLKSIKLLIVLDSKGFSISVNWQQEEASMLLTLSSQARVILSSTGQEASIMPKKLKPAVFVMSMILFSAFCNFLKSTLEFFISTSMFIMVTELKRHFTIPIE